jgi:hypothetical protein
MARVLRFLVRLLWPRDGSVGGVWSSVLFWIFVVAPLVATFTPESTTSLLFALSALWMMIMMVRLATFDTPAARPVLAVAVAFFMAAGAALQAGVSIKKGQVESFYTTLAQVDAALLIVTALEMPGSDERHRHLAFTSAGSVAASITAALIALGRGADSPDLFRFAVGGSALAVFTLLYAARERLLPRERAGTSVPLVAAAAPRDAPTGRVAVAAVIGWLVARALARRAGT